MEVGPSFGGFLNPEIEDIYGVQVCILQEVQVNQILPLRIGNPWSMDHPKDSWFGRLDF